MELGASATPNGHTFVIGGLAGYTQQSNPTVFPKLPYGSDRKLRSISLVGGTERARRSPLPLGAKTWALVALAKQQPGTSYASSGTGGAPHLAGELLKYMAKIDIVHIPYKGAAPVRRRGGHVQMMFAGLRRGLASHGGSARRGGHARCREVPAMSNLPGLHQRPFGMLAHRRLIR